MSKLLSHDDYQKLAADFRPRTQLFIDGRFVDAESGKTFDDVSPRDGKVIAQVAEGDAADIDAAVKAARRAFEKGSWANMAPAKRKRVLLAFAEKLREHRNELALLESLDMGKPIRDAFSVDVMSSANCIQWHAEAIDKVYDEVAPSGPDALGLITREPIGVVGAVVPWNFPMMMAAWKLGPALATGNSVIVKPAEQSPLSMLRVAELAVEAGLPEGVLNVVPGFGPTAGKALGLHPDVDCIAFTGSGEVGKLFLQYSGQSNMKRVWLEAGGKTPNIVMADVPDLDKAAQHAAMGIFFNQGEVCTAASRLVVQESIREEMIEKIMTIGETMQPGDPIDPATKMGAIVDEEQMKRILGYIEKGQKEGATLRMGGEQVRRNEGGFYVAPTVFDGVKNDMTIAREEIFGPVLSVISVKDEDEAVKVANDTTYGLAASIWTRDITKAHRMARAVKAGSVWVNCWDGGDMTMPFGGFKQSGNGRDKSLHAMDKYTEIKATWIDLT
ncbi:Aldehyde dehydrogenase [Caenispirillum salinarum AK4]|uniref:Aldehyde dehydrogenase n=1 Tax=Caenispirillum salinarum AK4 TaxID=1238182 RepID=K9HC76_9PROT|nr:aldehyde dehydrogenase [Caenispirillum salinarum]EKV28123.1 Aldehyde dehydrogenase [Caenispirillum salinarum AK4]